MKRIIAAGPISRRFLGIGIFEFADACEFVRDLPYGRTSIQDDYSLVLSEMRGTCSSKHALLAALGIELGISLRLMLGIYHMDPTNTPGVGEVLAKAGMRSIPEAHCYLIIDGVRMDFTSRNPGGPLEFVYEEVITPDQIGEQKRTSHQSFLRKHFGEENFEIVWTVREDCIAALAALNNIDAEKR